MLIIDVKPYTFNAHLPKISSQKNVAFGINSFDVDSFEKVQHDNEIIKEQKKSLVCNISEIQVFQENPILKSCALKMVEYSDSIDQLDLVKFILDKDSLHTATHMPELFGVVCAATNPRRVEIVQKIFSNENCYQNEVLLTKLESVLRSLNKSSEEHSFYPKLDLLDKVLANEKLYENEGFMDCLGPLLYETFSETRGRKNIAILDGVLYNEELSDDKDFVQALGNVLVDAEYDFSELSEKQKMILTAVSNIEDARAAEVFRNIVLDDELYNDDKFIKFLPDIMANISFESSRRINSLINYLRDDRREMTEDYYKIFISEFMHPSCNSVKFAESFVRVKMKAYQKKTQLQAGNEVLNNKQIDDFFMENHDAIGSALEMLGEKNFVHSYRLKKSGLQELCLDCDFLKSILENDAYYQKLLLKINPQASQQYIELQAQIFELKRDFKFVKSIGDEFKLKMLQNQISSLGKQAQDLLDNKLDFDPDTVINKVSIIANSLEKDSPKTRVCKLHNFIDLLQNSTLENDKAWQKAVCEEVFVRIGEPYDEKIAIQLGLADNKYVGKLLGAHSEVIQDLKEVVYMIKQNSDKSILELFEMLPSNKITREKFRENGLDYDKWIGFDENSCLIVNSSEDEEVGDVVIRKVDMNNFAKVLFLGNEAACCTAVGSGISQANVVGYAKNKFIGAIELVDNEKPVGNTMCYFAKVDGKLAFVMDNIHVKPEYRKSDDIRDGIIKYAQEICSQVGQAGLPIYISGHRNKVDLSAFESDYYVLEPIGDSGVDEIYWDCSTDYERIVSGRTFYSELTRVA